MAIVDKDHGHDLKWSDLNNVLYTLGYSVMWQRDYMTESRRYALIRLRPYERLGRYDNEADVVSIVRLLISQGKVEQGE